MGWPKWGRVCWATAPDRAWSDRNPSRWSAATLQDQPADRRECISIRCAPSPRRKMTRPKKTPWRPGEDGGLRAPVRRGEGAARTERFACYEPSPLPLPGVIHEGIVGLAAGAAAGAAAAALGFAL